MKTEIKNTLYRFVTMRAPELIDGKAIDQSFVQHPEIKNKPASSKYDSQFLSKIVSSDGSKTKKQLLNELVQQFEKDAIKDRHTLRKKIDHDGFYDFAIWLTKNRATFTKEDVAALFLKDNTIQTHTIDLKLLIELWDNLFYQIITFKSNYVRDEIISLLVANFFIIKYKESYDLESLREFAQARVLMPKLLFEGEESSSSASNKKGAASTEVVYDKQLQKINELLLIEDRKKQLQDIKRQLLIVEKKYIKSVEKSQADYDAQYKVDTKAAYAAATPKVITVTDPDTKEVRTYTDYENLILPEYTFKPIGELDYCMKISNSDDIYYGFVKSCINDLVFGTFNEVYEFIEQQLKKLTSHQFERTTTSKKVVAVNGVVLPTVDADNYAKIISAFTISTQNSGSNKYLKLTFVRMLEEVHVVSGNYSITYASGVTISGEYQDVEGNSVWNPISKTLTLKIFDYDPDYFTASAAESFVIEGTFLSSDNRELKLEDGAGGRTRVSNMDPSIYDETGLGSTSYINSFVNYEATGGGKYTYEDVPSGSTGSTGSTDTSSGATDGGTDLGTGSSTTSGSGTGSSPSGTSTIKDNVITYIPSGYGIKKLGIADYRKVEQQICCYVPGEVSHIENVMAREYKEKATRRLRRQEDTLTTSKEKETEKLTDTTSTDRFEMNQEVSSVLSESNSFGANVSAGYHGDHYQLNTSADFAHNTSQETSNHQALTNAQEITARVLDRVVQKVKEERITKIIEEFEETSKHGYDNRKGNQHISGVYRWVDKIYRNQVINYGKRLMYEFMIPEPAVFHNMATTNYVSSNDIQELIKPIDPRTITGGLALTDFEKVTESTYLYWAGIYNAEVAPMPDQYITVGKSFSILGHPNGAKLGSTESNSGNGKIDLPEGYETIEVDGIFSASGDYDPAGYSVLTFSIGNRSSKYPGRFQEKTIVLNAKSTDLNNPFRKFRNEVPVSYTLGNHVAGDITASVKCEITAEAKRQWQIETFNAIIKAYEDRLQEYNDKLAELKTAQVQKIKTNPMFYRQIENTVLRKNCIEYLVSSDVLGKESMLTGTGLGDIRAKYDSPTLESYAAKVKFFEQAFEWDIMSYNFYPFYWASKSNWKAMYNVDELDDPIFRAFLQSGMARVIITVRPGFEEAVNWYMATGQVWNGGQVPTMDDLLYVSIVKEMQKPEGTVEDTWESRVPTSLTVIQAGTIGLNVEGLPCDKDCEDNLLFDSDGNPVLDSNGQQMSVIAQNPESVQLGNITDELQTVTESIDEIKDDIQEIKTTLEGMSGGN